MATVSLYLAGSVASGCTVVEVLDCKATSQNARVLPTRDGKVVKDVKLSISTSDGKLIQSLPVGRHGAATLPTLTPGRYLVHAFASANVGADLCLDISAAVSGSVSSFPMSLKVLPPPPPTLDELISAAEKTTATEHLKFFQGAINDPGKAAIPGVEIRVFQKGFRDRAHTTIVKSNEEGRFSAELPDGAYTAVFRFGGFRTQIVAVEVGRSNVGKELAITLQLADCS